IVGNGHPLLMAWNTQLDQPAEVPLTVFPFISNLAAVVAGIGLGLVACVAGDQHPDLIRLSDVIDHWDVWMITNPEARNNARVRLVKDALAGLLEPAGERLSGGQMGGKSGSTGRELVRGGPDDGPAPPGAACL